MKMETLKRIVIAKKEAEEKMGHKVDNETAWEVLAHCIRKCKCANKTEDYLPVMYLYELPMQVEAQKLNEIGLMIREERRVLENVL